MKKQKMNETEFILKEYPNHIFSLSTPLWMKREGKGGAIMQTWLVVGSKAVLAIDSPFPENPRFRTYIEERFGLPVNMLNTHGHVDHIGCNGQFEKVYLAKEDYESALRCFQVAEEIRKDEVYPLLEQCARELEDFKLAYEYACKQK